MGPFSDARSYVLCEILIFDFLTENMFVKMTISRRHGYWSALCGEIKCHTSNEICVRGV